MKKMLILGVAALLVVAVGGYFWVQKQPGFLDQYTPFSGGDFTVNGADGPISLSDYRDKVTLIYFGYTFCPDVCPTSLSVMGQAMRALESEHPDKVKGILVSVDPDRDKLDHLKKYAAFFHPNIVGGTESKAVIDEVAKRYGVIYRKVSREGDKAYLVDHTAWIYVVNSSGTLVDTLAHGESAELLVEKVRKIL